MDYLYTWTRHSVTFAFIVYHNRPVERGNIVVLLFLWGEGAYWRGTVIKGALVSKLFTYDHPNLFFALVIYLSFKCFTVD